METTKTKDTFYDIKVKEATELDINDCDYLVIASGIYHDEIIKHLEKIVPDKDVLKRKAIGYIQFEMQLLYEYRQLNGICKYQTITTD